MSCTSVPPAATFSMRAAADRQNRKVASISGAREIDLEFVASRFRVVDGRVPLLAVEDRIHVPAAGEQDAVNLLDHGARALAHLEHTCTRT